MTDRILRSHTRLLLSTNTDDDDSSYVYSGSETEFLLTDNDNRNTDNEDNDDSNYVDDGTEKDVKLVGFGMNY